MTEPINPRDGGYGEIGCLIDIASLVVGAAASVLLEFLSPSGVKWFSIVAGIAGGWVVSFVAMDPVLNTLGRLKVQRRFGEPIFFAVAAVLPAAVTVAISLAMASILR